MDELGSLVLVWVLGFCLRTRTGNEPIRGEDFSWRPGSLPQTCSGTSSGGSLGQALGCSGHALGEVGVMPCRGLGLVILLFLLGGGSILKEPEVGLE